MGWRDGELWVVEMGVEGGALVREESRKPSARVVGGHVCARACMHVCVYACVCTGGSSLFGQCPH